MKGLQKTREADASESAGRYNSDGYPAKDTPAASERVKTECSSQTINSLNVPTAARRPCGPGAKIMDGICAIRMGYIGKRTVARRPSALQYKRLRPYAESGPVSRKMKLDAAHGECARVGPPPSK
ncbi:hypothetical protein C8R44DRAFT_723508 [Mycena epipterygia]|nr:hypothetical protein C8R44DRAFT_723508 [Mycena epipterygia]